MRSGQIGMNDTSVPHLIRKKLDAFDAIQAEFLKSFVYVQRMHGLTQIKPLAVAGTVRYLHALWVCDCKDLLLSVPRGASRYGGIRALELLQRWQEGATGEVVAFLEDKLDMLAFASLTHEIEKMQRQTHEGADVAILERLIHGRQVLLNRNLNLYHALDAIFAFSPDKLMRKVVVACQQYGHSPQEFSSHKSLLASPLTRFQRHPLLAQRNMRLMNQLGVDVTASPEDQPSRRSGHLTAAEQPLPAYADALIVHESFTPPPYSPVAYYPVARASAQRKGRAAQS